MLKYLKHITFFKSTQVCVIYGTQRYPCLNKTSYFPAAHSSVQIVLLFCDRMPSCLRIAWNPST